MRTDAELLRAARRDSDAFRELYERYAERIDAYHRRRCRHADTALELTAETFAQAWIARGRFRDEAGGSAGPWLFGIARIVLLVSVRKGRLEQAARERLGLLDDPRAVAPAPDQPDESWLEGLDDALADLPPGQREALRLRFAEDLPYDGMAEALHTTPAAARVRVHRALSALRNRLTNSMEVPR
jgi:RNA polymerase sigma factor (sigma-70 family)